MSFYKSLHDVFMSIDLRDISLISVFLVAVWFGW